MVSGEGVGRGRGERNVFEVEEVVVGEGGGRGVVDAGGGVVETFCDFVADLFWEGVKERKMSKRNVEKKDQKEMSKINENK